MNSQMDALRREANLILAENKRMKLKLRQLRGLLTEDVGSVTTPLPSEQLAHGKKRDRDGAFTISNNDDSPFSRGQERVDEHQDDPGVTSDGTDPIERVAASSSKAHLRRLISSNRVDVTPRIR